MFPLNSSLHGESTSWDTNFARTYLQISEDQLEKINKIPGWTKPEISEKSLNNNTSLITVKQLTQPTSSLTENNLTSKITSENIEKHLIQQTSTGNNLNTKTSASVKDISKTPNFSSDLKQKQTLTVLSIEKEEFLKNIALSPVKKKHFSTDSLQRSSSLPDLYKEILSPRKSAETRRTRVYSLEKDITGLRLQPPLTLDLLNKICTVPVISNESTGNDKLLNINSNKSLSCPLVYPEQKKLIKLDDILNQRGVKEIEKSVAVPHSLNLLERKLLLLEKRFSPSKREMSPPVLNVNMQNIENTNPDKNLTTVVEVEPVISSPNSVEILAEIQKSQLLKREKSLDLQDTNEKCESFLSQSLPCGQDTAIKPTFVSKKIDNTCSMSNLQMACSTVSGDQPLATEVTSILQPVPSQKVAKLNTLNESQNAEISGKTTISEKPTGTISESSAIQSVEKVSDIDSRKELGTKRKRTNKSERSSKKIKKDILFSSEQIRIMIEMMKVFQTEF